MKSVKLCFNFIHLLSLFESLVNYEECKTYYINTVDADEFESLVNYEECKTNRNYIGFEIRFESLVNYEECKTKKILLHIIKLV